jgi:hypothetical protein
LSDFNGKSDARDIREILEAVSDKVPKLIKEVMGSLYSKDAGTNMGQSVGAFYKELVDSGIPAKDALDMAKSYLFSIKDVMKQANPMQGHQHSTPEDSSSDDED